MKTAQKVLGRELCLFLLFAHAVTGCATTSFFYGISIPKVVQVLQSSQRLRADVLIFGDVPASKEQLRQVGEDFVISVYTSSHQTKRLNKLRYMYAVSPKYVAAERIPPTRVGVPRTFTI